MVANLRLNDEEGALVILDQTLLPGRDRYIKLKIPEDFREAIRSLRVRGAPAIGIAAAYGLYLAARNLAGVSGSPEDFEKKWLEAKADLASARPTAVNLSWALNRMETCYRTARDHGTDMAGVLDALRREAEKIHEEDARACRQIGEHGLTLLQKRMGILTHCNAGELATARYGTALAPVYLGQEKGYGFHVYADETRPLLQGARLTTYELMKAGVNVTLICDSMAATVMRQGRIGAVLVGCDRVAANGDTANKIGTLGVAILAKYYRIPFYVCAPVSTLDPACPTGREIRIEERAGEEITERGFRERMAPDGVRTYNPAFDVTEADLVTAFITENGIAWPPYAESLAGIVLRNESDRDV